MEVIQEAASPSDTDRGSIGYILSPTSSLSTFPGMSTPATSPATHDGDEDITMKEEESSDILDSKDQGIFLVRIPSYEATPPGQTEHQPESEYIEVFQYYSDGSQASCGIFPIPDVITRLRTTICEFPDPGTEPDMQALVHELLYLGIGEAVWAHPEAESKIQLLPTTFHLSPTSVSDTLTDSRKVDHASWHQLHRWFGYSPRSTPSSAGTYRTASSPASFMTARSTRSSPAWVSPSLDTGINSIQHELPPNTSDPYSRLRIDYQSQLQQRNLILPFDQELNWSGKGQHVTFQPNEEVPLESLTHLGSSNTATVDKVLCRRVALARKLMRCTRTWGISDALREVYHLQNLRHFHIIQLVGTYLQGRNFAILMYPAAECHLGTFLEDTADLQGDEVVKWQRKSFLGSTLSCLASAICFIHERTTKHMDIKPQNILIRPVSENEQGGARCRNGTWRMYIADFGLSRSFTSQDQSQTDGPTARTPKYCAPEVYEYESRGRSADIFSLGCVFSEVLTVIVGPHPHDFADFRRGDGADESFHKNLDRVKEWVQTKLEHWSIYPTLREVVLCMLQRRPEQRPSARDLLKYFAAASRDPQSSHHLFRLRGCCERGPELYVAYEKSD